MKPPIFVDDNGDLLVFETVAEAESYLEPVDVKREDLPIYDSEGLLLNASVEEEKRRVAFWLRLPFDRVVIQSAEKEPSHQEWLRRLLLAFLTRIERSGKSLKSYSLGQLVEKSLRYKTK